MASRLLALLLVLCVLPFTGEAAEYAVHWAQEGDAVHGERHRQPDRQPPDEDGCPDGGHLCHLTSCACIAHLMPATTIVRLPRRAAHLGLVPAAPQPARGLGNPTPQLRPPIA